MSDSTEDKALATVRQAKQLIADVQRQIDEGNQKLRDMGLDPSKVHAYVSKSISAEDARKAEQEVAQELEAIETEARHARQYAEPTDSSGKAKRPRSLV